MNQPRLGSTIQQQATTSNMNFRNQQIRPQIVHAPSSPATQM